MRTNRNISKSAEFWRKLVDDESLSLEERKNAARELRLLGSLESSRRFRGTIRKLKLRIKEMESKLAAVKDSEEDGLDHSGDPAYIQIPRIGLDDGKRRRRWRKRTAADDAPSPTPAHQPATSECNSACYTIPLTPAAVKPPVEPEIPGPCVEDAPKEEVTKPIPISKEDQQALVQWREHQDDRKMMARAHEANLAREEEKRLRVRRAEHEP